MRKKLLAMLSLLAAMLFTGCGGEKEEAKTETKGAGNLTVYCPHPLEFINPLINEFETQTGVSVEVIAAGTGELMKRVESEKDNPLADVLWGGTITTVDPIKDYFMPYTSPNEEAFYDAYKNVEGNMTRFTAVPSVIMINTNLIGDIKIEGYEDVLNPELKGKIAFSDPAKSSSSFEHLVNMLYAMGNGDPEKGWGYVEKLMENLNYTLLSGSSAVYKGVADGEYTVGLTFEEGAVKYVNSGGPVKVVYMEEGVIVKPDGVYIIKNCKNEENAKKFVDFITGKEAQSMISAQLNRRSIRKDVEPGKGLKKLEEINVIEDDISVVKAKKAEWLDKFKDIYTK